MKNILLALVINIFMTNPLWASVSLEQSFPKNGAMFMQSPDKVQLKFAKMVNLKSIRLFDAAGNVTKAPPPRGFDIPPFRIDGNKLVLGEVGPEYQTMKDNGVTL